MGQEAGASSLFQNGEWAGTTHKKWVTGYVQWPSGYFCNPCVPSWKPAG